MVTTAAPVIVRVPHPVQAGPVPAALWILRRLLNLALTLGLLWVIPGVVADYPANFTSWALGILLAVVVVTVISSVLRRIERNRVPGALRWYSRNEVPRQSWIPSTVANLVEVAIVIAALPYLLSRSDEHGFLAGTLALLGGAMLALCAVYAAAAAWYLRPGWKVDFVRGFLTPLPLAIVLAYTGLALAPDPRHGALACFWVGLGIIALGKVVEALFRPADGIRESVVDTLDDAADALTRHTTVAPTLRDRERSRAMIRAAAVTAVIVLFGLFCLIASL